MAGLTDEIYRQRAEIERLTRERDEAVTGYSVRDAEVTGLLARCAQHDKEITAFCAERDRLRAALDSISEIGVSARDDVNRHKLAAVMETAKRALCAEPSSDETSGDGLSIDETRFLAALAGVKPAVGSPGGMTAYGRTLIEREQLKP